MTEQENSFLVVFRQKSTGITFPQKIQAASSDEVLEKAKQECQAGITIGPEDLELWTISDKTGKDIWKAWGQQ